MEVINLMKDMSTSNSTWWPSLEVMSCIKRPNFEPICNKSENAQLMQVALSGGQILN